MYRSQEYPQTKIYDEDIEHLKSLISKLISSKQESKIKAEGNERIAQIEEENKDLSFKIVNLTRQNKQLIRQLLIERQQNTRLKSTISQINQSKFNKPQPQSQLRLQSKYIETLSPSSNKIYQSQIIKPQYFSPLKQPQSSSLNRDQLYRLNSYLIEYNTNIKLLVQKYNYLIKLRGLNFSSDVQELKVINQANQIFSNRKTIQEAKSILKTSRKKYFDSQSSSDIEDQCNQIEQSP